MKNKLLPVVQRLLPALTGLLFIYSVFAFMAEAEVFHHGLLKLHVPYFLSVLLIVVTVGAGLECGFLLVHFSECPRRLLVFSVYWAIYMLVVQIFLTLAPGVSSCNCVTFHDILMNVQSWSRIYPGMALIASSLLALLSRRIEIPPTDRKIPDGI